MLKELQGQLHTKLDELRVAVGRQGAVAARPRRGRRGAARRRASPRHRDEVPRRARDGAHRGCGHARSTPDLTATAWIAVLDAVVASPMRRSVHPAGHPRGRRGARRGGARCRARARARQAARDAHPAPAAAVGRRSGPRSAVGAHPEQPRAEARGLEQRLHRLIPRQREGLEALRPRLPASALAASSSDVPIRRRRSERAVWTPTRSTPSAGPQRAPRPRRRRRRASPRGVVDAEERVAAQGGRERTGRRRRLGTPRQLEERRRRPAACRRRLERVGEEGLDPGGVVDRGRADREVRHRSRRAGRCGAGSVCRPRAARS